MKKVLFIDRDGTLVHEPKDTFQVDSFYKLEFYHGALTWLARIAAELDYELVMVTNQDGLGTASFPEDWFWPIQNFIVKTFAGEGVHFTDVHIDRTFPAQMAPTRKPGIAMLTRYLQGGYDLEHSFVIGDRITDVELAKNLGCKAIWMEQGNDLGSDETSVKDSELMPFVALNSMDWKAIYSFLRNQDRMTSVHRKTKETDIHIQLNLDGSGEAEINTGLAFFDHMLEQIARHGGVDLHIDVDGDLEVDEHHTIEDVGIALGDAFTKAMGKKTGMSRYGFSLPMDDCAAQCLIDFGGRPYLKWKVKFERERIGDVPTEMFSHFFESFSQAARCNVHLQAKGDNEHHKIEAVFKAFSRAVHQAIHADRKSDVLPSTKGVL